MRILMVDDEPINLRVVGSYLSSLRYDVQTASSGKEALGLLEKDPVDLILLDVMMPDMSGYEVCREIRWKWSLDELPVLLLTAKTGTRDRVAGFEAGANDYLIKPVERSELIARVEKELQLLEEHRKLACKANTLAELLPLCASCKRVRRDDDYWEQIEDFLNRQTEAEVSHGLCPDCVRDLYGKGDQPMESRLP